MKSLKLCYHVAPPKLRSRHHTCLIGCTCNPIANQIDGKVLFERVSVTGKQKEISFNWMFSDDFIFSHLIKPGDWRDYIPDNFNVFNSDVINWVAYIYNMPEEKAQRLTFSYHT